MRKTASDLLRADVKPAAVHWILLLILLAAAVPRIFLLARVSDDDFYHNDGGEYMAISRQLASGNGFSIAIWRWHEVRPADARPDEVHPDFVRTPLFPLLGAGLFFLPWDVTASAKAVSLLLSLLAVYCVFLLGREIAGRECGLWSAALFAIYPYALYYSASWSTENLFLILLSLSVMFLVKALRGRPGNLAWCGFFLGLTALTRPTALLMPAFFLMLLWLRFMAAGSMKWKKRNLRLVRPLPGNFWRWTVLFLLTFSLLLLPWMYRNKRAAGSWNPATYYDGYIFWLSFSNIMTETYRTLDTPEYAEAAAKAWDEEHARRHKLLREKGITTFLAAADQWRKWGWEQIRRSPGSAVWLLKERFLHYWRMCPNLMILKWWQIALIRIYFSIVFLLALLGAYRLRFRLELPVLLIPVLFGMAVSIPFLFVLRFRFPFFAPYICIFAGISLVFLRKRTKKPAK